VRTGLVPARCRANPSHRLPHPDTRRNGNGGRPHHPGSGLRSRRPGGIWTFRLIDADKEGYLDYLKKLEPLVRPGGLIVAHNMARPRPDPRYVEAVTTDKDLDTVFINMHAAGVGLSLKKR
jgi:hypothetical protein